MSGWYSLECPGCGYEEAIHTIHGEDDHEINCQRCDLIERDDEDSCSECGEAGE